jgi:hypothetical protein
MTPRAHIALFTLLLLSSLAAVAAEESLDALKTRANSATGAQRVGLCLKVAELQLRAADKLYTESKVEDARAAVNELADYSDKATQTAIESGKKVKDAEISVRKMAHKLTDIKRTLNLDDQQPVQDVIDRLEHLRTRLLSKMFGSKK